MNTMNKIDKNEILTVLDVAEKTLDFYDLTPKDGGVILKLISETAEKAKELGLDKHHMVIIKNGFIVFDGFSYPHKVKMSDFIFSELKHYSPKIQGVIIAVNEKGIINSPGNKINLDNFKIVPPKNGTDYYIYYNKSLVLYHDHITDITETLKRLYNKSDNKITFHNESMSEEECRNHLKNGHCLISMTNTGQMEEICPQEYLDRLEYVSMTFGGQTRLTNNLYMSIINNVSPHNEQEKKTFREQIHSCRHKEVDILLGKYNSEYDSTLEKILTYTPGKGENPDDVILKILLRLTKLPDTQKKNFDQNVWITNRFNKEMAGNVLKLFDWAHGRLNQDILQ